MSLAGIDIEHSDGLIWVLRYPDTFRLGDFRQLFLDVKRLNPTRKRHAVLIDFRKMNPLSMSPEARRESAEVFQEHGDYLEATCIAEARVAPNPVIRGILTVFDWLGPKPWPINSLHSGETAELWLQGQLVKSGYTVPGEAVWARRPLPELTDRPR